jgi:GNAT superfamily N-acetyltransferase
MTPPAARRIANIKIIQDKIDHLAEHGQISIAFEVRHILELTVADGGLGGFVLRERSLASPYIKDYDSIGGSRPSDWRRYFDISNWALHSAWIDDRKVGGVVTAFRTDGLDMLERREDLAVIWDIRVSPDHRGRGVGSALFAAAEGWAKAKGCRQLKIETQNVNVAACRFYMRQGCTLGGIHRFAYPLLPEELQLLWYKDI